MGQMLHGWTQNDRWTQSDFFWTWRGRCTWASVAVDARAGGGRRRVADKRELEVGGGVRLQLLVWDLRCAFGVGLFGSGVLVCELVFWFLSRGSAEVQLRFSVPC